MTGSLERYGNLMVHNSAQDMAASSLPALLRSPVAQEGSATHPHFGALMQRAAPLRDLADAAHFLCMLHGRHPGLMGLARDHAPNPAMAEWLEEAAAAFAEERSFLVRLAAAAGPLPSTPGQDACDAAIAAQQHALDMLGRSDRVGCAAGAAVALVFDWAVCRSLLVVAADRLGLDAPDYTLPHGGEFLTVLGTLDAGAAQERAMLFGAQQLVIQHRGLWDLLESRAEARRALL